MPSVVGLLLSKLFALRINCRLRYEAFSSKAGDLVIKFAPSALGPRCWTKSDHCDANTISPRTTPLNPLASHYSPCSLRMPSLVRWTHCRSNCASFGAELVRPHGIWRLRRARPNHPLDRTACCIPALGSFHSRRTTNCRLAQTLGVRFKPPHWPLLAVFCLPAKVFNGPRTVCAVHALVTR